MLRLAAVTVLFFLAARPAFAYLDPGAGSVLVQALLASLAVLSGALVAFWSRIKRFFTRHGDARRGPDTDDDS